MQTGQGNAITKSVNKVSIFWEHFSHDCITVYTQYLYCVYLLSCGTFYRRIRNFVSLSSGPWPSNKNAISEFWVKVSLSDLWNS